MRRELMKRFIVGLASGLVIGLLVLFFMMKAGKLGRTSDWWYTRAEIKRLEKAYAKGDIGAAVELSGFYYSKGRAVQAFKWIGIAAEKGDPEGQDVLSEMYLLGVGTATDTAKAKEWMEKASAQNYLPAMHRLAEFYYSGQGGPPDYEKALDWFVRAAEHGDLDAAYMAGFMYENGRGVKADSRKAIEWYLKCHKNPKAIYAVAGFYEKGKVVKRDILMAHKLYRVVMAYRSRELAGDARDGAIRTYKMLTPAQLKELDRLAKRNQNSAAAPGGKPEAAARPARQK